MTGDPPSAAWVVRVTDLPTGWARQHGRVALNCHIRADVGVLTSAGVELVRTGGRAKHARELATYAHEVRDGDTVLAVSGRSKAVLVGTFAGPYEYRPDLLPEQPHSRRVLWHDQLDREDLKHAGIELPGLGAAYAFGRTGQHRQDEQAPPPPGRQAQPGAIPRRCPVPRRDAGTITGRWIDTAAADEPRQACPVGRCQRHTTHRYLLEVPLLHRSPDGPHVLAVGVNPSCPDEQWSGNFLAQLRPLAEHLGASSMGIVNLISRRTQNLKALRPVPADALVGPRQPEVVGAALRLADVVVLAHGVGRHPGQVGAAFVRERRRLHDDLRRRQGAGLPVLTVGEREVHPRQWNLDSRPLATRVQLWSAAE